MEEKKSNKNNAVIIMALAIILAGAGSFYGGMKYGNSKGGSGFSQADFQNFRNLTPEQRQERMAAGANGAGLTGRNGAGASRDGGFIAGEIIKKDDQSITVKLADGGSKIIYLSGATEISVSESGSNDDLEIGKNVMATGSANEDGSIAAQLIQIRPDVPNVPNEGEQ